MNHSIDHGRINNTLENCHSSLTRLTRLNDQTALLQLDKNPSTNYIVNSNNNNEGRETDYRLTSSI